MRAALAAVVALLVHVQFAFAQTAGGDVVLNTHVYDDTDSGSVSRATVLLDRKDVGRTDGRGRLRVRAPAGNHDLEVRALGYIPFQAVVMMDDSTTDLQVPLTRVPVLLSQMTIHGRSVRVPVGFERIYQRAAMSAGVFLTKELIDSLGFTNIPTLLRSQTNLRVRDNGATSSPRCTNFDIFLNGTLVDDQRFAADVIANTPPGLIQAMEIYQGQARVPRELVIARASRPTSCGVIAVWTRDKM